MMDRRGFLTTLSASAFLSVASPTPAQARDGLRGGNMAEFVKRQAEKQRAKREKIEQKNEEQREEKKEEKEDSDE